MTGYAVLKHLLGGAVTLGATGANQAFCSAVGRLRKTCVIIRTVVGLILSWRSGCINNWINLSFRGNGGER